MRIVKASERHGGGRAHLPAWFRTRLPNGAAYRLLSGIIRRESLHTVCDSAICPNRGECWSRGVATFLIMGDVCTRSCAFCNVRTGRPGPLDDGEVAGVALAVRDLRLRHVVITSVDRDDLPDGGASFFSRVIREVRHKAPGCAIEVLVPDFRGSHADATIVMEAAPEFFGHNIETVPSLYRVARRGSVYERSLSLLRFAAGRGGMVVKTGLMVGLGEKMGELLETMAQIRETGCEMLTVGQYLQPSPAHLPVRRYYEPGEFGEIRETAMSMGFSHVTAGPLVRSSYLADLQASGEGLHVTRGNQFPVSPES